MTIKQPDIKNLFKHSDSNDSNSNDYTSDGIIPIKSYAETTLRMASWLPPQHPWVLDIMVPWIEKVKVATEGRVRIELLSAPIGPPPAHFNFAVNKIIQSRINTYSSKYSDIFSI